ncbi:AVAST type 4 anti-phage nuclease Avs4 [Myroides odoratimimus]|uniref:AAA+ ATPase domain-containing protein n=1 Tax=Myroides odoratimimus CIP 101113 TaxID=883154 RepID=A0AAV3F4C4_9FLAO|nr:AVAST type 4 anti-phage nuclease Avs4 [Myroides odoratimimus]EHO13008.1 hypothetical protein HMPREF9715_01488 [Myroides odoratimimus CIP 101113]
MNWKVFELKYDKQETSAFERLSYLLFCLEFDNKIGLFRYKNQTGIETEPIEKDGVFYGFQAKYYTTSISSNKDDIIDSIKKAKAKNSQLNTLFLYTNKELAESPKVGEKKTQYQKEIEEIANSVGISICWRVPSHFELQLTSVENKYLYDIFFNLEPNGIDLMDEVEKHNDNILKAIQTEIQFGNKQIKIDRALFINSIKEACKKKKNIIISGEGGCGKTAILKEFYNECNNMIPICIFKANELNVSHINDIFRFDNNFTFKRFLEVYNEESIKVFVIDSAEKLAEIANNDIIRDLLIGLINSNWNIIFTTRYAYLNDLTFIIRENYEVSFEVNDVSLISANDLMSLSRDFEFNLPENLNFLERIRNLFYLNEYIRFYSNIDKQDGINEFIDLLWKKKIQNNSITVNYLHIERDRCLISIAKQRCQTGRFYIKADNLPEGALFQLSQDEILGYDELHDGHFITHDIYEEWALAKIVSRCFINHLSIEQFFEELGDSLPIRRAFRLWISGCLANDSVEIQAFIYDVFINNEISQFWKDEILISVLLSNYSKTFFEIFEGNIIKDDFEILKRILFLLRIACTNISSSKSIDVSEPKGKGWEEVILIIYKHKSDVFESNLKLILPILVDWCDYSKTSETTRLSGLLALSIIQKTEIEKRYYLADNLESKILKIIFNSVKEIEFELKDIFDKVIANEWTNHNDPYAGFCSEILSKPYEAIDLIKIMPSYVIELCKLFWQPIKEKDHDFGIDRSSMESKYGITSNYRSDYFPASAYQTPIYYLLKTEFFSTLDFIIDFINEAVNSYSRSDYGVKDVEKVILNIEQEERIQYLSPSIWTMYRGNGSPVVPDLLQSIHMALEKILLEYCHVFEPEIIEKVLLKILKNSKSTSLTSVVCSIVLAHPDKYYNIALILFKTIELFNIDNFRCLSEGHVKSLYSIGYGMNPLKDTLYANERIKTCEDEHRGKNLESLFLSYQFFGVKEFTEEQNEQFIERLYQILDGFKLRDFNDEKLKILLIRIDRRNLAPNISEQKDGKLLIELIPQEFPEELKKVSEQAQIQFEDNFKFLSLNIWSDFLIGSQSIKENQNNKKYNDNPLLALIETKQLIEELNEGKNTMVMLNNHIPAFSCSKLIIEHIDKMQQDDKDFCKEVILSTLLNSFSDQYGYQISDGVEACFHALPSLMIEYPDDIETLSFIMLLSLFDKTHIGQYKRFCDYVIEALNNSKLWSDNQTIPQSLLLAYIKLKPSYNEILKNKRRMNGFWKQVGKTSILEEFEKVNVDFIFEEVIFDIKDLDLLDIHDLEIVWQLIPSNTKNKIHLEIYEKSLPLLASQLLIDRRDYKDETGDRTNIYSLRLHIFEKFSSFILQREKENIDKYLDPFLNYLSPTEETASFIREIIFAQDTLRCFEQFWHIWDKLFLKLKELCDSSRSYYIEKIIINFLLADHIWSNGIKEWHSLTNGNLLFYNNVSNEMGYVPAVLYSISRVLNTIGSNFDKEGINWIYNVVIKNKMLHLGDLELYTIDYLERYLRKFIFNNRQTIKREVKLKSKVIIILDFMIERGSVHGYLLRENIL